ncbi:MAG: TRAP transporter small permease subunit [Armatimonadota bacterium]|nr:TRAP transporter small permease subunit [Armatimonadota bacterium]
MKEAVPQAPDDPLEALPAVLQWLVRRIDGFTQRTGQVVSWLTVPMVFSLCYEVISRKFLGRATVWSYDVTYMLYGSLFMLAAGFTLLRKEHIRTDFFYARWPVRTQALVDVLAYVLVFFPAMAFFLWKGTEMAVHSWQLRELSEASPWRPPLYPFRTVLPVGSAVLLLQGISEFLKALAALRTGRWPE